MVATPEIASIYLGARARIDDLVRGLGAHELDLPTPTCPGWTVRGVVAHLVGTVEWFAAGKLQGPPSDEETAAQIAERLDIPVDQLLDTWAEVAPDFADQMAELDVWPAAIDAITHEHDIRQALGRPGARDHDDVRTVARLLLGWWRPGQPVEVVMGDDTMLVGQATSDRPALGLRTSDFETLRWRMGRRSRRQLEAMDWSGDPSPVLDSAVVFGPSPADIEE